VCAARCTILGGTNGSGKSSIFETSLGLQFLGEFVNADIVARSISADRPEAVSAEAGRRVIARLADNIVRKRDFVFETTLSSHQSLQVKKAARDAGYHVGLFFIVLDSVGVNVHRVHERVSRGGHFIPDQVIHRRYRRALENLPKAIRLAHETAIYDNSLAHPIKLAELSEGRLDHHLDASSSAHREIAGALAQALGISIEAILEGTSSD
jgi:predicted ABC-type ATPase